MKKFFQSKGFIVSVLVVLCVAIPAPPFMATGSNGEFKPDESPPSSTTGDWSDGGAQNGDDSGDRCVFPGQSPSSEERNTPR